MGLSKFIWIFLVFVALRVKVNSTYTIKKNLYNYISIFFSKYCSLVPGQWFHIPLCRCCLLTSQIFRGYFPLINKYNGKTRLAIAWALQWCQCIMPKTYLPVLAIIRMGRQSWNVGFLHLKRIKKCRKCCTVHSNHIKRQKDRITRSIFSIDHLYTNSPFHNVTITLNILLYWMLQSFCYSCGMTWEVCLPHPEYWGMVLSWSVGNA